MSNTNGDNAFITHTVTLADGWYDLEREGKKHWRWTGGKFRIIINNPSEFIKIFFHAVLDLNPRTLPSDSDYALLIARNLTTGQTEKKHFMDALQIQYFQLSCNPGDIIEFSVNPVFIPPLDGRELGIQVQAIEAVKNYEDISFTCISISPIEKCCNKTVLLNAESHVKERVTNLEKLVLAFYYLWYSTPDKSGQWRHWDGHCLEQGIADNIKNTPELGLYDSSDSFILKKHIEWAEYAGIDAFIVSWWNDEFEKKALRALINELSGKNLKICFHIEYDGIKHCESLESIADYLFSIMQLVTNDHLLIIDGHPIFFIHILTLSCVPSFFWKEIKNFMLNKYNISPIFMADENNAENNILMDGTYQYNWFWNGLLVNNLEIFQKQWSKADISSYKKTANFYDKIKNIYSNYIKTDINNSEKAGGISCATISPGFDDTKLYNGYGLTMERGDGRLITSQWEAVLQHQPDLVLINSWNEFHEGSDIEPSHETSFHYLDICKRYIQNFKRKEKIRKPSSILFAQGEKKQRVLSLPQRVPANYGVPNPGATSLLSFYLAGYSIVYPPTDFLIEEIDKLTSNDLIIYPGDNFFIASAVKPFDILTHLQSFLNRGGVLILAAHVSLPLLMESNLTRDIFYGDMECKQAGLRPIPFLDDWGIQFIKKEISPQKYEYDELALFECFSNKKVCEWNSGFSANWYDLTIKQDVISITNLSSLAELKYKSNTLCAAISKISYSSGGTIFYVNPNMARLYMDYAAKTILAQL